MNYFANVCLTGEHSAVNLWCAHSCFNSFLTVKHRLDISTCQLLRRILTKVASKYAKQKTDVFQKGVTQKALREMDDNNLQEIADKIAICLLFLVSITDQRH